MNHKQWILIVYSFFVSNTTLEQFRRLILPQKHICKFDDIVVPGKKASSVTFVFKHYICLRKRDDISKLSIHCTSVSGLCSILFEKSQERSNYLLDICKVMQDPFRRFTEEITPSEKWIKCFQWCMGDAPWFPAVPNQGQGQMKMTSSLLSEITLLTKNYQIWTDATSV